MPEAAKSIESGSLNLTTASQLQNVFEIKAREKKPFTIQEKQKLFAQVQNQSRREVEQTLASLCPEAIQTTESVRAINQTQVRVELVINQELLSKIEKLKMPTSHKNKTLIELLEHLVDGELKRRDPAAKAVMDAHDGPTKAEPLWAVDGPRDPAFGTTTSPEKSAQTMRTNAAEKSFKTSPKSPRYIPSTVRHHVWMRDKGQCSYVDPKTKRKCQSRHKLQYEHIKPFALGGAATADNLRLLCASHNTLMAVGTYGLRKMERHTMEA
jgi:hypothetical protein